MNYRQILTQSRTNFLRHYLEGYSVVHEKTRAVNMIDHFHFLQSYYFAVAAYMFEREYREHRLYCSRLVCCLNEHRTLSVFHFDGR